VETGVGTPSDSSRRAACDTKAAETAAVRVVPQAARLLYCVVFFNPLDTQTKKEQKNR